MRALAQRFISCVHSLLSSPVSVRFEFQVAHDEGQEEESSASRFKEASRGADETAIHVCARSCYGNHKQSREEEEVIESFWQWPLHIHLAGGLSCFAL